MSEPNEEAMARMYAAELVNLGLTPSLVERAQYSPDAQRMIRDHLDVGEEEVEWLIQRWSIRR